MKQLYLDIIHKLNYVKAGDGEEEDSTLFSLHKNLFLGQLSDPESIPDFPCILIDLPYTYYKDVSARIQHGYAMVKIMVCFETSDMTGEDVTAPFDLKDYIYSKVQGLRREPPSAAPITPGYSPLTRGGERVETKYLGDGVYVFEMDFYTTILDTGTYTKKAFVNASTYDPISYPFPPGKTSRYIELDATVNPPPVEEEEED